MIDELRNDELIVFEFRVVIVPVDAEMVELLTLTGVNMVTVKFVMLALVAERLEQLMLFALTLLVV